MSATEGFHAVVPAAGSGSRMRMDRRKPYLPLAGATVLEHALRPLLAHPALQAVVICVAMDDAEFAQTPLAADPRVRVVTGGASRAESVRAGLHALQDLGVADGPVVIHDGARPCLRQEDLARLLTADWRRGALLATPLADTLKRADGDSLVTVDRRSLWRALTPQLFGLQALAEALEAFGAHATDESSAMELAGHSPVLVQGSARNIKITLPDDLELAAAILAAGEQA